MTTHHATRLMPAGNAQNSHPTQDRTEVNNMAIFESRRAESRRAESRRAESRRAADKRASDQMSGIDRAVILESMRQRRKAQKRKASIESGLYNLRSSR